MRAYRAYLVGEDGHFRQVRVLDCENDDSAIEAARQIAVGLAVEVWERGRKIARIAAEPALPAGELR
jgi:hypothetical protein